MEQRKKAESNVAGDSDILKIINATSISKVPTVPASSEGEGMCLSDSCTEFLSIVFIFSSFNFFPIYYIVKKRYFCICHAYIQNSSSLTFQTVGSPLKIVFINIIFPITLGVLILPPPNNLIPVVITRHH